MAFTVNPVTTDIVTLGVYTDTNSPIKPVRTGYLGNPAELYHIGGAGQTGGSSWLIAVSNGQAPGGPTNPSGPLPGAAIDIANGGDGTQNHRLQDGNTFRFSVWMRINPDDPVTYEPSVEPVMKFELWKTAQSTNTDYTIGREIWAGSGDRLWDNDVQAPEALFQAHNQTKAPHFDISGNGTVIGDNAATPPADGTVVAAQWKLFQSTITIDDNPDGSGQGWLIGGDRYKVDQLQELRATFFTGDYFGTAPAAGGSFYVDNAQLEVFPDATTMAATPNLNPMPQPAPVGDYNNNGIVDAADYTVWRDHLGQSGATLANRDPSVTGLVKAADYTSWVNHFGNGAGSGAGAINYSVIGYAPSAVVPEPTSILLSLLAGLGLAKFSKRRQA
ncbi:MAG TPA: PEP-CTERM sorting domain-containing protein [Lacipirellulaceae bacterium]